MLWRKITRRSHEEKSIFSLVKINDRVQLEIRGRSYLSRIEDITSEEISIASPIEHGNVMQVKPGTEVALNVHGNGGFMQFKSIASRVEGDRIPVLVLKRFIYQGILQRRNHVRVISKLHVNWRQESGLDRSTRWLSGITKDISAGGVHMIIHPTRQISIGDFLELQLFIPNEKPVLCIAHIVRVVPLSGGALALGTKFVQIHPDEQRRITRYVTRKQTEILNAHGTLGTDRAA